METKKWYLSKGVWAGIVGVIVTIYITVQEWLAGGCVTGEGFCANLPAIPEQVLAFLIAAGVYSRATAKTKLTK